MQEQISNWQTNYDTDDKDLPVGHAATKINGPGEHLTRDLQCPRCGYDVRGQVATWNTACPLQGRCSECGLEFEWAELFSPERSVPLWCIEYVPTKAVARGCAGTLARSFVPWRFWSRLRLSHPIRPQRVLVYLMMIEILPLLIGYILMQTTVAIVVRAQMAEQSEFHRLLVANRLARMEQDRANWEALRDLSTVVTMDQLPDHNYTTGREVEMRFRSDDEWEEYWATRAMQIDSTIEMWRHIVDNPTTIHMPYMLAIVEAVAIPFAKSSFGSIAVGDNVEPYIAPAYLYDALQDWPWPGQVISARRSMLGEVLDVVPAVIIAIAGSTVFLVTFPLTFILLPITRRRAKVHAKHFARIIAYSFFVPCIVFWTVAALLILSIAFPNQMMASMEVAAAFALLLPLPMAWIWWYFAIKRHLLLPNAFWLVAIMSVLTIALIPGAIMATYYAWQFIEHVVWMATV